MQKPQNVRVGIGVFLLKDNKVLMGKRRGAHGVSTWSLPGGHLEFRESPEDCARREVLEETGITISEITSGPWSNDVFESESKHYITLYTLALSFDGDPILKEPEKCEGWHWCGLSQLPNPLFLPLQSFLKEHPDFIKGDVTMFKEKELSYEA